MNLLHRIVENAFFSVDNRSYWQARHYGLNCHLFQCLSKTSDDIHGQILLPKNNAIKGTVFYCHPAIFNLEFNLPQVAFLCQEGYQVVMFDYAGCGQSSGKTQLDGLYTDTQAAFDWWKQSDYFSPKVALFAQGVGCDAALQLYEEESELLGALILESPYCTRKGWIVDRWGPVLGHIAASQLTTITHEPADIISNVKVPLLLIYPEHDQHTHKSEKQALLKLIPPTTTIWNIPRKKFLQTFGDKRSEWHERLIRYLSQKLP